MSASAARRAFPVGCVIIGVGAPTPDGKGSQPELATRVAIAYDAGAEPVILVVERGVVVAGPARRVELSGHRSDDDTALRLGLSQLTSVAVSATLIWPSDAAGATLGGVLAVIDAAKRTGADIVEPMRGAERLAPVLVVRDLWRELLTTSGGLRAVMAMHAPRIAAVDVRAL